MTDDLRSYGKTRLAFGNNAAIDAFARMRVSEPLTLFDSKQIFDNLPLFWDDQEVSGSGTSSTYSKDRASSMLAVTNATAGKRIRQTYMSFNYQPGKSQLVLMTGTLGASGGGAGIKRAAGLFNDDNGIFFEDNEGTIQAVIRSSTSGSPVDSRVSQEDWNIDKLDGAGDSKVTLDGSKSQILIFDFEWLGVGRVRMGFVMNGRPVYCHEFLNSNNLAGVYMSTPNLPLRYEIENTGTGVASELEALCSTIISEGGRSHNGIVRYHSNENNLINANAAGAIYACLGLRLKSTHLNEAVELSDISMISSTADSFEWLIIYNPTVANSGSLVWTSVANSGIETTVGESGNPSITTVTGGEIEHGGYVKSVQGSISHELDDARRIGAAIDGTPDEVYICVRPLGANADIAASVNWRELS
jgi:hypothetical protein